MDWLRAYEGERGVGYVMVISSGVAPSLLALYWLDESRFLTMGWALVVLLSLAIGALLILPTFVGTILVEEVLRTRLSSTRRQRNQSLMVGLVVGSAIALVTQLAALGYTSYNGQTFKNYVTLSFALTFLFLLGDVLSALLRWAQKALLKN